MKLQVKVDGKVYQVEVEILEDESSPRSLSPLPASADPPHMPAPAAVAPVVKPASPVVEETPTEDGKILRSPISGVVVRLSTSTGQTVSENQELIVLEAMKMETVVASQCAGKISKIHANVGDSVQVRQALIEFE